MAHIARSVIRRVANSPSSTVRGPSKPCAAKLAARTLASEARPRCERFTNPPSSRANSSSPRIANRRCRAHWSSPWDLGATDAPSGIDWIVPSLIASPSSSGSRIPRRRAASIDCLLQGQIVSRTRPPVAPAIMRPHQVRAARNRPGVTPISRRKIDVRWLWSTNPASCAIWARGSWVRRIKVLARSSRRWMT